VTSRFTNTHAADRRSGATIREQMTSGTPTKINTAASATKRSSTDEFTDVYG
jgi:hypothetical protein